MNFCKIDYHSCDKGSVEQSIGLVRRYLPKQTNFALITQDMVDSIAYLLNRRPRKCLTFKTPLETLTIAFGVALTC